jgi:DNA-binding HxlR family transcriptional regulator
MNLSDQFPPSVYCPYFQRTLELIGRRWTAAILRTLFAGKARFTDIESSIPGLSARLLSRRLSELVQAGLVEAPGGSRQGAYALTERGLDLRRALAELEEWNQRWESHDDGPPPADGRALAEANFPGQGLK